jgi:ammonia channel protein AmtB
MVYTYIPRVVGRAPQLDTLNRFFQLIFSTVLILTVFSPVSEWVWNETVRTRILLVLDSTILYRTFALSFRRCSV